MQGKLHKLGALFRVIEPTRRRSMSPIHRTTVRNEHAYYQTVAQVMAYRLSCCTDTDTDIGTGSSADNDIGLLPLDSIPSQLKTQFLQNNELIEKNGFMKFKVSPILKNPLSVCCDIYKNDYYTGPLAKPIYVVGDSHTVPLAWNVIRVASAINGRTEHRLLVPKLVTGIKQYHLRKESDFYPKLQFANLINKLPDNSDILFVLGEIDCREGILVGVQKDAYENIRQGMEQTINHFGLILPNLLKKRKMNIFIHPVLPMLQETRGMVIEFNNYYKKHINAMNTKLDDDYQIKWLDFFDQLIENSDGADKGQGQGEKQLRKGLRMDGTHITPGYVALIEAAMHSIDADIEYEED